MSKIELKLKYSKFTDILVQKMSNAITSGLWGRISYWMLRLVLRMFEKEGGEYDREQWPAISPNLWGMLRHDSIGGIAGFYTPSSKPLQASGTYKKSFKLLYQTPQFMHFGSRHPKADRIPYGGWQNADNPMMRYTPRYVMPDPASDQFNDELSAIRREYLDDVIKKSILEAGG